MSNPEATPADASAIHKPRRWGRILLFAALTAVALTAILVVTLYFCGYSLAKNWVQSPAGQRLASQGLGHAIKVNGQFAPMHLEGWTIKTDSFTSTGWPGEVIGQLNAKGIVAVLDPGAVFRGEYRVKSIDIDSAEIRIVPPNDALKLKMPPKKPRPWYAYFLPSRFVCGPMISPHAKLIYSFQGDAAEIHDAYVRADLIGKDMQYTATSGVLDMPYLPPLHINMLKMLVTRPEIKVYAGEFSGIEPGSTTRLSLSGRMGMREDKSIDATGDFTDLPISEALPKELRSLIHGTASGHLTWKRDVTGKKVDSEGEFSLKGASLDRLAVFDEVKMLEDNVDMDQFVFDQAACQFHIHDGIASLNLQAKCVNKFTLNGTVNYHYDTKFADIDMTITELPLQTWLPNDFKSRFNGMASAHLVWSGRLDNAKESTGTLGIDLDGTRISNPILLRRLMESKGMKAPDEIFFKTAQFDFAYQDQALSVTRADLDAPGILTAHVTGKVTPEKKLIADISWDKLVLQKWLPPKLAQSMLGTAQGDVQLDVSHWKLADGAYGGQIALTQGELLYTPVQSLMARFFNDRTLLDLPLTQAQFAWSWNQGALSVDKISIRGRDLIGVKGDFALGADKQLSGVLWIGAKPEYLKTLSGLGDKVFDHQEDGLLWAKVQLGGTLQKPKQDLSGQLLGQLGDHPWAVFPLGAKLVSWMVGNWFGEQAQWGRPEKPLKPDVQVSH